ncbi:hypothetical protein AB4Z30_28750 [Paenibacillus sp. 2TAF8]|uniref:hypothetical protein n=1 Tax=Paenibacillus sp. 2TAF8 TaxID=3233020 RepID=UPI003F9C62A4
MSIQQLLDNRVELLEQEQRLYKSAVVQINLELKDMLSNNFSSKLIQNTGRDLAGEIVRNFWDTSDYNITVDQMAKRILEFTYEDEYDPLSEGTELQKKVYNYNDSQTSSTLKSIMNDLEESKVKLFNKENGRYSDIGLIQRGKQKYREGRHKDGSMQDDYVQTSETTKLNSRGEEVSQLHVEHTQALSTAYVYNRYLKDDAESRIREFYNSSDNFTMMFETANQSKGDVKVTIRDSDSGKLIDITHRATPEQMADAVSSRWETLQGESKQKLQNAGYLNEDGKVPKRVKTELVRNYRHSQNAESKEILKETNYFNVAKDAAQHTGNAINKIIAGQLIYYIVPAVIYELKGILANKKVNLKNALHKLEQAGGRIVRYVYSKLNTIYHNILNKGLKKFIKSFFDILINLVKATVQQMIKLVKNLVLSFIDAIKIIGSKHATPAQKADSVFQLMSLTVTSFVLEVLFGYIERQIAIPEFLLLPLQIISAVVCSNLVMLILEKMDLFNVRHGLLVANIQQVIQRENQLYMQSLQQVKTLRKNKSEQIIKIIEQEIEDTRLRLQNIDPHRDTVLNELEKINHLFKMDINFEEEWKIYLGVSY